jgi:hypothetical protein
MAVTLRVMTRSVSSKRRTEGISSDASGSSSSVRHGTRPWRARVAHAALVPWMPNCLVWISPSAN